MLEAKISMYLHHVIYMEGAWAKRPDLMGPDGGAKAFSAFIQMKWLRAQ